MAVDTRSIELFWNYDGTLEAREEREKDHREKNTPEIVVQLHRLSI